MNCEECVFFEQSNYDKKRGYCHRSPPQMSVFTDGDGQVESTASWPQVDVDDWCGEFKKADSLDKRSSRP